MNNSQFQRTAKNTKRKALVFTIVFHALLFGGITFGTEMGNKITDTVKEFFQDEQPTAKKKEPLAKNKK